MSAGPQPKFSKIAPVQWIARIRSIRQAMERLARIPDAALLILPTTRSALILARQICVGRDACVMAGPICASANSSFHPVLRSPPELARELAGHSQLPRTVISFPDQLVGHDLSFAWIRFLGSRYAFSIIEALLALRHRPRILGLRTCSIAGDFELVDIPYLDLLDPRARLASLQALMERLLAPLERELERPPEDWLGARWLELKSEAHWRFAMREELKDMECLLRLHLLSPGCDRSSTGAAVAAVVARQRAVSGAAASRE